MCSVWLFIYTIPIMFFVILPCTFAFLYFMGLVKYAVFVIVGIVLAIKLDKRLGSMFGIQTLNLDITDKRWSKLGTLIVLNYIGFTLYIGKTELIQAFVNGRFTGNYPITGGMDTFHKTILVDGWPIKIGFVDTPGLWDYDRFRRFAYPHIWLMKCEGGNKAHWEGSSYALHPWLSAAPAC